MTIPHSIKNKTHFYELARKGFLGNQFRVWYTIEDFKNSGYTGNLGLRYMGTSSFAPWLGNKIPGDCAVESLLLLCEQEGYNPKDFAFCEAAPESHLILQGEVQQAVWGMEIRYTTIKDSMRTAFEKESLRAYGANAFCILRSYLSPASFDDIQVIFDWFPEHVIEFATFSIPVGWAKGRNTVIWEVRKDDAPPGWYVFDRECSHVGECIE